MLRILGFLSCILFPFLDPRSRIPDLTTKKRRGKKFLEPFSSTKFKINLFLNLSRKKPKPIYKEFKYFLRKKNFIKLLEMWVGNPRSWIRTKLILGSGSGSRGSKKATDLISRSATLLPSGRDVVFLNKEIQRCCVP